MREYSRKTKISSYFITFTKINSVKIERVKCKQGWGGGEGNTSELEIGKELI